MKLLYLRLFTFLCMLFLILVPHCSIFSPGKVIVLVDSSQSMRRYSQTEIEKITEYKNAVGYTFGIQTIQSDTINFDAPDSCIDWEAIPKEALCILVTDGYINEKGQRSENVFPIRFTDAFNSLAIDDVQIQDIQIPSTAISGENTQYSLSLTSLAHQPVTAEITISHKGRRISTKTISIQPEGVTTFVDVFRISENGLQQVEITLSSKKKQSSVVGYIRVDAAKTQLLITGSLSPDVTYLRRYFADHPLYEVHTLIKIGQRFLYDNEFVTTIPPVDRSTTSVISVGQPFVQVPADIIVYHQGHVQRQSVAITDLLQEPIPLESVRIFPNTPDHVYHRAGSFPVLFTSEKSLYIAIPSFYTYYMRAFHHYDAVLRRALDIHMREMKKHLKWSFEHPILYRGKLVRIFVTADLPINLNDVPLRNEPVDEGYMYSARVPDQNEIILKVGNETYRLRTNEYAEPMHKTQNVPLLSTFANGVFLSPDVRYDDLVAKIQRNNLVFSHYPILAVVVLLLLSVIWWKEYKK